MTDGRGTRTRFAYDANGNLTSRIEAEGTSLARTTTWDYGYAAWPSFWTTKTEPSVVTGPRTTTRAWGSGETTLTLAETGYVSDSTTGTYTTVQTFDARHRLTMVDGRHGHDGLHLLS